MTGPLRPLDPAASVPCPLCGAPAAVRPVLEVHGRRYLGCGGAEPTPTPLLHVPGAEGGCGLLFLAPEDRPSRTEERARYETHENDPDDPRYQAFLAQAVDPLATLLPPGAEGLDYGAGPGPALSGMMRERGFPCVDWDPFFAPDPALVAGGGRYDWIACTETAEHFADPQGAFARLDRLLRPGGWLVVMTEPVPEGEEEEVLRSWYYLRDPTHVSLYREQTLAWIASSFRWSMTRVSRRVSLFRKTPPGG